MPKQIFKLKSVNYRVSDIYGAPDNDNKGLGSATPQFADPIRKCKKCGDKTYNRFMCGTCWSDSSVDTSQAVDFGRKSAA